MIRRKRRWGAIGDDFREREEVYDYGKRCPGGHRRTNISHELALERPFSFFFVFFFLLGAGVGII